MRRAVVGGGLLALLASCAPEPRTARQPQAPAVAAWIDDTSTFGATAGAQLTIADRYRATAGTIIAAARNDRGAYRKLADLTDHIGHRISGSPELDRAIAWAVATMKADGHDAHAEAVTVPHWVRGAEDAAITAPIARPLHLIGLGGTVATPRAGITAPIVVVHDWTELDAKRDAVKHAIVLYDVAMPPWTDAHGSGYGETVDYRVNGPSRAAHYGAVAVLMRSVTAHSLQLPHTGNLNYAADQPKIPAAAVTVEDSELLTRLAAAGAVTVHLHLESQDLPEAPSANVIGELRGRDKPDEVVVIGGHIDSWDVGQGAQDDGAGCVIAMQALTTLRKLGLTPRRTIRVVLWTNEENGLHGGKGYAAQHAAELDRTVLAIESDSGGFSPRGFSVEDSKPEVASRVRARMLDIVGLLRDLGATRVVDGHAGADVEPLVPAGVPALGLDVWGRTYFDIHHTEADTLDKVDPEQLAADVATVAVVAYIAADLPERLDAPAPPAPAPAPPAK